MLTADYARHYHRHFPVTKEGMVVAMRNVRKFGTVGLLAVGLIVAAACGGGDDGGNSGGGDGGGTTIIATQPPPTPTVDNSIAEAAESASATIEPLNGSSVGGTASVVKSGGGSEVTVEATGLTGAHSVYLKNGGCEGTGQRIGPLTELAAGADGTGSSVTPLPASRLAQLLISRSHVVIYEGGQGAQGAAIGCGELVAD